MLCDPACMQVLNGASQIYPFLRPRFFLTRPRAKALIPSSTFGEYKAAFPLHETYADNGHVRVEDVAVQTDGAAAIVFATPNNTAGTTCDPSEIIVFARKRPGKTVLLDESFLALHTDEPGGSGSVIRCEIEKLPSDHSIYIKDVSARFTDGGAWWRLAVPLPEESFLLCERIRQS